MRLSVSIRVISTLAAAAMGLACNRTEYICSAYQSSFFLDRAYANEFFSAKLDVDSMPKVTRIQKTDFLLVKPIKRSKKEKSWKVVPMITVFPESAKSDSTAGDSTQAVPTAVDGKIEGDGLEKTNFLSIPGESRRERKRREKREAAEKERREATPPKEETAPKQPEPEKPF